MSLAMLGFVIVGICVIAGMIKDGDEDMGGGCGCLIIIVLVFVVLMSFGVSLLP